VDATRLADWSAAIRVQVPTFAFAASRGALLWLALALLVVALSACGGGEAKGNLGAPITSGDYQLTATDLENPAQPPDRFTNPKPGNRFVKMNVLVENTGQQHLPLSANYFTLRDSGGIDNPAVPGIPSDRGLRQMSVAPGQRFQGVLYFEMAANQRPEQLVFAPGVVGWRNKIAVDLPREA
jgi:hypothetical protein